MDWNGLDRGTSAADAADAADAAQDLVVVDMTSGEPVDAGPMVDAMEAASSPCDLAHSVLVPAAGAYRYGLNDGDGGEALCTDAGAGSCSPHVYASAAGARVSLLSGGCWSFDLYEVPFQNERGHVVEYLFCPCDAGPGLCSGQREEIQAWIVPGFNGALHETVGTSISCNPTVEYLNPSFESAIDAGEGMNICTGTVVSLNGKYDFMAPFVVVNGAETVTTLGGGNSYTTMHTQEDQASLRPLPGMPVCGGAAFTVSPTKAMIDVWLDCATGLPIRIRRSFDLTTTFANLPFEFLEQSDWILDSPYLIDGGDPVFPPPAPPDAQSSITCPDAG